MRNPGPSLTTGRTRVWVEIPPGVVLNGDPNGSPFWTYAGIANGMLEFYTDNSIPTNAVFATDIAVPARITATSGTIRTRAFIDNPSDRCNADGSPPVAGTTTCPQSSNNTSVVDINVVEQPPVVPANIPTSFAVNGPS